MTSTTLAGLVGAALVGLGLYGVIADQQLLRKILAFNLIGSKRNTPMSGKPRWQLLFVRWSVAVRRAPRRGYGPDLTGRWK